MHKIFCGKCKGCAEVEYIGLPLSCGVTFELTPAMLVALETKHGPFICGECSIEKPPGDEGGEGSVLVMSDLKGWRYQGASQ